MPNSPESAPAESAAVPPVGLAGKPWLLAFLSLIIPGLGQILLGAAQRGWSILLSVVVAIAIILWQDLTPLFVLVAFVWLWNVWDAYSLARGVAHSFLPPLFATLIVVYVAGWIITEIEPEKLISQANRAAPIVQGLLSPDFVEREAETQQARAPFEVHCSAEPPPTTRSLQAGVMITLSTSCGEVDDMVTVTGQGFWPEARTEMWWVNPIGDQRRLARGGEQIVVTSNDQGSFTTEITVPLAVPLSSDTGEPQPHSVEIRQTRIIGGWRISENGALVLQKMGETIAIAMVATTFAIVFAIPLSFVAARNLMSANPVSYAAYYIIRTLLNIVRSIESLIIAIVFVVWVGLGPFAGLMALTIHSIAALSKLYSEQVENIEFGPIEAIRSTGSSWLQTVVYAVLPQVVPPFLAFTIYRWDINVRMSTILGFVGGGGIGFLIVQWQRLSQWRAIGAAFFSIMVIVAILDFVSAKARERLV